MDSKLLATRTRTLLKEMGHDVSLGHIYELYSKLSGYKSWNVASQQKDPFKKLLDKHIVVIRPDPLAQKALLELEGYAENGLPKVYDNSMYSYTYDFIVTMGW